jgi:hypothetical protein
VLLIVGTLTKQVLGGLHNLDRNATYLSSQADDRKSGSSIDDPCEQQAQELPARLCSQKPSTEEAGPLTVRQLQITKTDPGLVGGEISLQSLLVTTKTKLESAFVASVLHPTAKVFCCGACRCHTGGGLQHVRCGICMRGGERES